MKKAKDIFIGVGLTTFALIIWIYKILVTSDIPVEISYKDSMIILCMLVLFLILYSFYLRKTKYILMNGIVLSALLYIWFIPMQQALIYHYQDYDTWIDIMGFSAIFILFLQLIYRKLKINIKN